MKNTYLLIMFVMMAWGFNVAAIKILVSSIDPLLLTSARIFTAGVLVLFICYLLHIFRLPSKKELQVIVFISIFNIIIHQGLLAFGLLHTSGINAGLIGGINPLSTLLLSILFISRDITWPRVVGFILGFVGVAVTTLAGSKGVTAVSIGDLLVLLSILSQSISFILIGKLKLDLDIRLLTGYFLVAGSIGIFFIGLANGSDFLELTDLFSWKLGSVFLFSAFVSTAFGQMSYNYAIKKIGPAETTIFINFSTVFALIGSVIFLGETVRFNHLIGLVLIVSGVLTGTGALEHLIRRKKTG